MHGLVQLPCQVYYLLFFPAVSMCNCMVLRTWMTHHKASWKNKGQMCFYVFFWGLLGWEPFELISESLLRVSFCLLSVTSLPQSSTPQPPEGRNVHSDHATHWLEWGRKQYSNGHPSSRETITAISSSKVKWRGTFLCTQDKAKWLPTLQVMINRKPNRSFVVRHHKQN